MARVYDSGQKRHLWIRYLKYWGVSAIYVDLIGWQSWRLVGWGYVNGVAWSMTVSITMRKQTFPSPTSEMFAKKKFLNRSAKQNSATWDLLSEVNILQLENKYDSSEQSLLDGSEAGKCFARCIRFWCDFSLAPTLQLSDSAGCQSSFSLIATVNNALLGSGNQTHGQCLHRMSHPHHFYDDNNGWTSWSSSKRREIYQGTLRHDVNTLHLIDNWLETYDC